MADQSWIITTAVGTGEAGYGGDGGPAARALLNGPFDVGFDGAGNRLETISVFVAETAAADAFR